MSKDLFNTLNIDNAKKYFSGVGFRNEFHFSESIQNGLCRIKEEAIFSDFYTLALCKSGNYTCRIDDDEYELSSGSMLFGRPRELHMLRDAKNYKGILITFTRDFLAEQQNILAKTIFRRGEEKLLQFDSLQFNHISSYFKLIESRCNGIPHRLSLEIIRNLLVALICEVSPNCITIDELSGKENKKSDIVHRFENLLNDNLKVERKLKFYADKLFMTSSHLSSILKEKTGFPARDIIQNRLLEEIKLYLKTTHEPIHRVADEFNFSDAASLIHFFKGKTETTPDSYRNQNIRTLGLVNKDQ